MNLFLVGALLSLVWCLGFLSLSFIRASPWCTFFPEIDFASKIPGDRQPYSQSTSLSSVLSTLSLASSFKITEKLSNTKFHVTMNEIDRDSTAQLDSTKVAAIDHDVESDGGVWARPGSKKVTQVVATAHEVEEARNERISEDLTENHQEMPATESSSINSVTLE